MAGKIFISVAVAGWTLAGIINVYGDAVIDIQLPQELSSGPPNGVPAVFLDKSRGRDSNPGTAECPVRTLLQAIKVIRGKWGAIVFVGKGEYYLDDPATPDEPTNCGVPVG